MIRQHKDNLLIDRATRFIGLLLDQIVQVFGESKGKTNFSHLFTLNFCTEIDTDIDTKDKWC